MILNLTFALGFTAFAASLLYLASPNQAVLHAPLPKWSGLYGSLLCLFAAGYFFLTEVSALTTVFALMSFLMLFLTFLPFIGAWVAGKWKTQ